MLLKSSFILLVGASHFRSGSFQFSQDIDNADGLILTRTMNYRRGFSGYDPACSKAHVRKAKRSERMEFEHCLLERTNQTCGVYDATYIVNDIETQGFVHSQWCYGYVDDKISKPKEAFEYYFQNCCWVDLTDDDGTVIADGYFKLYAKFNNVDNNSPQVKVPPIWRIMTGCPDQRLHLNPSDKDGDKIRCRWSTKEESKDAFHGNGNFASLTLDGENCHVTYDGSVDSITGGVKPIAIHVEDFDDFGNIKSSIPVQFLATVWQPKETGKEVIVSRNENPEQSEAFHWGDIYSHHDEHHYRRRRDFSGLLSKPPTINPHTGFPFYCDEPPQLIPPSPPAGAEIEVTGEVAIDLRAMYYENLTVHYDLKRFQFNSPQGMICSELDRTTGKVQCTWLPTLEQKKKALHDFCFLAIDKYGRDTERRCITLKIINLRDDIHSLLDLVAPEFAYRELNDYGCAGRGSLDPFLANAGSPVDEVDHAIKRWKYCVRCAMDVLTDGTADGTTVKLPKYTFDEDQRICLNDVGSVARSICECDVALAATLAPLTKPDPQYQGYSTDQCLKRGRGGGSSELPSCCGTSQGFYRFYYGSRNCCEDGKVLSVGECIEDEGNPYEEKIEIVRPEYIHVGDNGGKDNNGTSNDNGGKGNGKGKDPDKWNEGDNDLEGNL